MKVLRSLFASAVVLSVLSYEGCQENPKKENADSKDTVYSGPKFNDHIRSTTARTPEEERQGFKLPEGFEVTLFASEPDIGKPINLAFDAKGRMWVTQSFEYPFPANPGKGKDRLTILEDSDNDGKADKFTHFDDTLNIPIGVMPLNDGALAYSIPNVYRYTDANGDGKPESQKKLLGPFEHKDTHGMVNNFSIGYDGWIHSCHGYTNFSHIAGADGDSIHMRSGNTFRFKRDGSRVEHTTNGRINPFGLAWDELGYLYSTDCHTSPLYQLIRGGDYSQWGKEEEMGFAPDMKPLENEATALAGIAYYADNLYPENYRKNFYIGDAVSCRVYRNSFVFRGSSPVGKREEDFVLSADPWFRPVDVKLGPDGALYIADFYNSIIGHYEVPLDHPKRDRIRGRIWRISYKGKVSDKIDWTTANIQKLLEGLNVENLAVRLTVADQIVERIGQPAVEPLKAFLAKSGISSREYIHALWALERLNAMSPELISASANNPDAMIRVHTMRALAEKGDSSEAIHSIAVKALSDPDPHVRRAGVELMSKYRTIETINQLIAVRKKTPDEDTHLIYTVRLTLRNLLRYNPLMREVAARKWSTEDGGVLATVMAGVMVPESGQFLFDYVKANAIPEADFAKDFMHITRFIPANKMTEVVTTAMSKSAGNVKTEYETFRALQDGIARKGGKENAQLANWGRKLAVTLVNKNLSLSVPKFNDPDTLAKFIDEAKYGLTLAGNYKVASLQPSVLKVFQDTASNIELRGEALSALLKIDLPNNLKYAGEAFNSPATPEMTKRYLLGVIGGFPTPPVFKMMAEIKNASPDIQQTIVMALAGSSEGRQLIFNKVRKGEILPRILIQPKIEERLMIGISSKQKQEFEKLTANLESINKEKQALILTRITDFNALNPKPDPTVGRGIFVKTCTPCHSIGGEGGAIGPNLDGVGKWGVTSLCEKILDPNRNISETFRNYTVKLKDGKVLSGLFRRDEGEISVFADVSGKEFSVPKKEIAEKTASKFTLMPDQFSTILTQQDFNSLIAYLLTVKN